MTYQPKVYRKHGGDELVVASGGLITVEAGGSVAFPSGSANDYIVQLDVADISAEASYFAVAPFAGSISKIWTVVDGAVLTADATVTAKIATVAVTNGAVTIATAGGAAGDVDSATPTAANVVTAGQAIEFVVAGGGAAGTGPRLHIYAVIAR
ncbi:hypothetical protein [Mesorhizobium sp.]|uniref:hypothetical protein n=1 Tax=Mesorhizobium sp. TaxID=1871066 RepID=UPI00121C4A79|nr:hypothetical protein [Mesorhizobium sp.]TIL38532.1 MAG: hypothetical protein E5Y82_13600 [Mesorhizobium sp.]